jgi:class 3 adenylate cyclase
MQRVLYETTALNAMGTLIFEQYGGGITEFLGDGFLGFFLVDDIDDKEKARNAHKAAKECLRLTHAIINPLLSQRYNLEPLDIGIGMAYSQAMITTVGSGDNLQPKAIGQCVYRASKLCKGQNTIAIDKALRLFWPKSKNGKLRFLRRKEKLDFESFVVERKLTA